MFIKVSDNIIYVRCVGCGNFSRNNIGLKRINKRHNIIIGNCADKRRKGKTLTFKEVIAWRKCKLWIDK